MDLSHARVVVTGGSGFLGRRVVAALTAQNELPKNQFQVQGASIKASGRAKAITAEAVARKRANELLAKRMTPALVEYEIAKKWDGKLSKAADDDGRRYADDYPSEAVDRPREPASFYSYDTCRIRRAA